MKIENNNKAKNTAQIVFLPSGKRGEFQYGTKILHAARELGVDLDSVCGGRGICGRCQIEIAEGNFDKLAIESWKKNASDFSKTEKIYQTKRNLKHNRRLGCATTLQGPLVIDIPPQSQMHRQIVRKELKIKNIKLKTAVRLYMIKVNKPDINKPDCDIKRVAKALKEQWKIDVENFDLHVIQNIQKILRKGKWNITIAVYNPNHLDKPQYNQVIAAWSDFHDTIYGLSIDIGSTTIAAHLCDLTTGEALESEGIMNPQIRFGEDLMSRVSFIMMNDNSDIKLTQSVRQAVQELAEQIIHKINGNKDNIIEITIVGNPIMQHLFLGINPVELGVAPFALAYSGAFNCLAKEVGLYFNQGCRVYTLPSIAGHVGGDTAAAILSEQPYKNDENQMIVDIGTNAEIVIGNKERLFAASSPTGPAFEGAQISCGQRAATGAIERVRINKQTLEPKFKIIGAQAWSDEEDFKKQTAKINVTGLCGSAIIEVIAEMFLVGIINSDGRINEKTALKNKRIVKDGRTFSYIICYDNPQIKITQNDIRAVQLAKAALYAGTKLLMDKMNIDKIDAITLAGAFGSQIDTKYAMLLGLLPDCNIDKVRAAGNAAGTGAVIALLDKDARNEIENIVTNIHKIETAVEKDFQKYFIDAIAIPNKNEPTPNLDKLFEMPAKIQENSTKRRRSRLR